MFDEGKFEEVVRHLNQVSSLRVRNDGVCRNKKDLAPLDSMTLDFWSTNWFTEYDYNCPVIQLPRKMNFQFQERSPFSATYYSLRGNSNMKLGKFDEAIDDCTKAVELDARNEYCGRFLSLTLFESGKFKEAIEGKNKI